MSDNFNIDELFEDSLGGMKQKPKEMSWDNIEQELDSSTPSETQFDNMVAASMAGFSAKPSATAWNGINDKLDDIDNLNKDFDTKVEESMNNMYPQASRSVWSNIEQELDAMDAYRIAERKKFISWFSAAGAVAAVFIYFMLQIQPNINFRNKQSQLINKSSIDNSTITSTNNSAIVAKNESNSENINSFKSVTLEACIAENTASESVTNNVNIIENENLALNSLKQSSKNIEAEKAYNDEVIEHNAVVDREIVDYSNNSFNSIINDKMSNNNLFNNDKHLNIAASNPTSFQNLPSIRSIKASTGFSFDLFGGPEFIHSPNEITFNEGGNIFIEKKSAYIKDYSFGANIKYHYNNMFIQSGLVYSNFGDVFSLNQENEIHDTSGGYYTYNINTYYTYDTLGWDDDPLQPGVLVPVLSSNLHTDTVITGWNSSDSLCYENELAIAETRYRYIEIPLMFGYQLAYKDWGFLVSAGASYGFKVADKAEYTSSNKLSDLDRLSSPYSDSNINGIVSLGLSYAISDKISVVLQPTYKTNLTGFTAQSTRYHSFSIRCGINVKL